MKVPQKMPLFLYYIRRKSLTERKMGDILLKVNPQYFARDWKKKVIILKLSTKGKYGLRAIIDLARFSEKEPVSIGCIATRQKLSERYLEQLFALLKKAGLVKSIRGASGGYVLARDASEISVGDVLRALEGNLEPVRCAAFYSEEGCMASDECVTKYVWQKINDSINKTVNEIKLDELVKESKELNPEGVIHGECSQQ